jgi:hypothetical protein
MGLQQIANDVQNLNTKLNTNQGVLKYPLLVNLPVSPVLLVRFFHQLSNYVATSTS